MQTVSPEEIICDFSELIQSALQAAQTVIISSIPPVVNESERQEIADQVNDALSVLCEETCVTFVSYDSIVGSLRDREVTCSTSDHQDSNFESCVWRTVSSHSSHHPQIVLLAQFSPYMHRDGLKPDSFISLLDKT